MQTLLLLVFHEPGGHNTCCFLTEHRLDPVFVVVRRFHLEDQLLSATVHEFVSRVAPSGGNLQTYVALVPLSPDQRFESWSLEYFDILKLGDQKFRMIFPAIDLTMFSTRFCFVTCWAWHELKSFIILCIFDVLELREGRRWDWSWFAGYSGSGRRWVSCFRRDEMRQWPRLAFYSFYR